MTLEPSPLQPKGSVMSFGAQALDEVDRPGLVMREVELSEEVEAISALVQELASEHSVWSGETTSDVPCGSLSSTVTLRHLLSGVACGKKAMLFLFPGRVPGGCVLAEPLPPPLLQFFALSRPQFSWRHKVAT